MDIIARNTGVKPWATFAGETFWLQSRYLSQVGTLPLATLLLELSGKRSFSQWFVLLAGVGDQFFPYAGEYAHFMDLSPAYRFSWTVDRSNNRLHIMLQVNRQTIAYSYVTTKLVVLLKNDTRHTHDTHTTAYSAATRVGWGSGSRPTPIP
jgi:hypothetical protein